MQVQTVERTLEVEGALGEVAQFAFSAEDSAHLMMLLRDTLYTDKILAVLREYGANAWDAHRDAGIPDRPIQVNLPTLEDPTLRIRDFGKGLSKEECFALFPVYGRSTKRNSNNTVGALGIGSKSAYAYTDTYTVTSYHGGMKRVYIAALGESGKGDFMLFHEEPSDETGIDIQVTVQEADFQEFQTKAADLFAYFTPTPECNFKLRTPKYSFRTEACALKSLKGFGLDGAQPEPDDADDDRPTARSATGFSGWRVVMGCVPYRIDLMQFNLDIELRRFADAFTGTLYADIGSVDAAANREELKYTTKTKTTILAKFTEAAEAFGAHIMTEISSGTVSDWEKRKLIAQAHYAHVKLPAATRVWAAKTVNFTDPMKVVVDPNAPALPADSVPDEDLDPKDADPTVSFRRWRVERPRHTYGMDVNVETTNQLSKTRVVFVDVQLKKREGYSFDSGHDWLVYPRTDLGVEVALAAFKEHIVSLGCAGMPIVMASTCEWKEPYVAPKKQKFRRARKGATSLTKSLAGLLLWDGTAFVAAKGATLAPDALYVQLDRSQVIWQWLGTTMQQRISRTMLQKHLADTATLAAVAGEKMPQVLASRTAKDIPVGAPMLYTFTGRLYSMFQAIPPPKVLHDLHVRENWARVAYNAKNCIETELPAGHPMRAYLDQAKAARARPVSLAERRVLDLYSLHQNVQARGSVEQAEEALLAQYPMLNSFNLTELLTAVTLDSDRKTYLEYIRLVDRDRARRAADGSAAGEDW